MNTQQQQPEAVSYVSQSLQYSGGAIPVVGAKNKFVAIA
jgi:hypothetical protein